jgi:succinyl-CoA synthetase alpha subunit
MGHAGALISGEDDTAAAKFKVLEECGITVAHSPADLGLKLEEAMKSFKK